jgi:hypothetical protein
MHSYAKRATQENCSHTAWRALTFNGAQCRHYLGCKRKEIGDRCSPSHRSGRNAPLACRTRLQVLVASCRDGQHWWQLGARLQRGHVLRHVKMTCLPHQRPRPDLMMIIQDPAALRTNRCRPPWRKRLICRLTTSSRRAVLRTRSAAERRGTTQRYVHLANTGVWRLEALIHHPASSCSCTCSWPPPAQV